MKLYVSGLAGIRPPLQKRFYNTGTHFPQMSHVLGGDRKMCNKTTHCSQLCPVQGHQQIHFTRKGRGRGDNVLGEHTTPPPPLNHPPPKPECSLCNSVTLQGDMCQQMCIRVCIRLGVPGVPVYSGRLRFSTFCSD